VPRALYPNDDAAIPAAPRFQLRAPKALIPAQPEHVSRVKFEDARGAARLDVRKHPLRGSKMHGFSGYDYLFADLFLVISDIPHNPANIRS
jgi:hypothetical protein